MNFTPVRETHHSYVPVTHIVEDASLFFRRSEEPAITDIQASLARHGQAHPVTVESLSDGKYRLLDGHRRLAAVRQIHATGGTWHKLLAHVLPAGLTALDRFRVVRERNDVVDRSFGFSERGRFFAAFRKQGLCVATIGRETGLTVAEVEDHLELADMPPALAARLDRVRMSPLFAAMLARRYQSWTNGPYADRVGDVLSRLLGHAASESLTIKSWRFLLDFYWSADRPFMAAGSKLID